MRLKVDKCEAITFKCKKKYLYRTYTQYDLLAEIGEKNCRNSD